MMREVMTLIMAGGRGTRLEPLTRDRAKPAVPFGGMYRIIDFTLSNCINSGLRKILVLTQFKARSLHRHIRDGWTFLSSELGDYVDVMPPQQQLHEHWYSGTADAIYQNIYNIELENPRYVLILAGDHIYKMNYGDMIAHHEANQADLTIGCIPAPLSESKNLGVVVTDEKLQVTAFKEKPPTAEPMPGETDHFLASMGIYVFSTKVMYEQLIADAANGESQHDFGKNIIPAMIKSHRVFAFRFRDPQGKTVPYWRDVGTQDAYYAANMDLVSVQPELNLYETTWPIRTAHPQLPPPKFVFYESGLAGQVRRGEAHESIVCNGSVVSGGRVWKSILSPLVRVNSYAQVEESILFDNVDVGRHCQIRRAIIDKDVKIPKGMAIGHDRQRDLANGLLITDEGITIVPKGHMFEHAK
jgi:glucose-1-phosphate adenylyltransferase